MNKKFLILPIILILIGALSGQAMEYKKEMDIVYNNLKVEINGEEFIPKTEAGNIIEPFIYNGTTYLPVRGIANAFNLNVSWIAEQNTVILEQSKRHYLDELPIISYERESYQSYMAKNKTEKSEHGLKFYYRAATIGHNDSEQQSKSTQKVVYNVPTGSKTLNFDISRVKGNAMVRVVGHNEVLYSSPTMTGDPDNWSDYDNINVSIDVSQQKQITFEIELQGQYRSEWTTDSGIQFENIYFER